jgi:hypothetical protein
MSEGNPDSTAQIATAAAKEALREFFLMIGVDVSSPKAVIDLQRDFHHVRNARETVGNVRDKLWAAVTSSAVTACASAIAFYIFHKGG